MQSKKQAQLLIDHQVSIAETIRLHEGAESSPASLSNTPECAAITECTAAEKDPKFLTRESPFQPRRFGDYELLQEIGRGAMGVVYRAQRISSGRIEAVKFIHDLRNDLEKSVALLNAEAEIAELMNHPQILRVHGIGVFEGRHYLAMPYIDGQTLDAHHAANELSAQDAAKLIRKLADAMIHVHEKGIIHCDLKPANVLIDSCGQPHITDFGIARRMNIDTNSEQSHPISGTPCFMSPEQAVGDAAAIGPTTDVYALGAMLYYLLTGRCPFSAKTLMEMQVQILVAKPTPPGEINSAVDHELQSICLKCLEKMPENRFSSAQELAHALQQYLNRSSVKPATKSQRKCDDASPEAGPRPHNCRARQQSAAVRRQAKWKSPHSLCRATWNMLSRSTWSLVSRFYSANSRQPNEV